ncbi:membrane protein [Siminovitchia terrae]|uniref:DMT family transporter n=1 Tax=Siminovitchia terrae TaxID=1914933 RepID=A0A429XA54_SIMTE|nr:DMT family transporter [Siminovitchia terrae]RST60307.1 DMT family transporter [Siminovitchia terrae]GIN89769.1 membrane protein [Siminovitchia terrae]GIN97937.1 membrane protein [Siminovitchia terrae]
MQQENKQTTGMYFLLLLVPLFWGGAFGAAKHIITEVPPITTAAFRFGLAGLILFAAARFSSEWNSTKIKEQWMALLLMALTGIFGYNVFFFMGLEYTSAVNGSLIVATTPVFVTLGAVLFLGETWSARLGLGLIISLTGVFLVIINGSFQTLKELQFNAGDLLFIAALICWVVHGLIGKVVLAKVSPFLTTTVTTIVGSIFLTLLSLLEKGWGKVLSMSYQAWGEMAFMVFCASIVGFFLWNKGIQKIGASRASMYMNLVPINAAWIAFFLYDASISWQQIAGMLMVIFGVYVSTTSQHKRKKIEIKKAI